MSGLVGDGAVGGAAEVGVGDEPGAEAVGGVAGVGSMPARATACLDEGVDDSGVSRRARARLLLLTGRNSGPSVMPARLEPVLEGGDGAAVGVAGAGEDDELGVVAASGWSWTGAGSSTRPLGWSARSVDVEGGEFAAAEGGDEPDQDQGPVAERRPGPARRAGLWSSRSWWWGRRRGRRTARAASAGRPGRAGAPWVRRIPSQTATTRALLGGVGQVAELVGELDRRQPPAHGADLGAGPGQLGQVAGDRRRGRRQRLQSPWSAHQPVNSGQSDR